MAETSNNRRHQRVAVSPEVAEVKINFQLAGGGMDTRVVSARDISRTGLSFNHKSPAAIGTRCTFVLSHQRRPMRIIGKVTNCRPAEPEGHAIGIKFVSITPVASDGISPALTNDPAVDRLLVDL